MDKPLSSHRFIKQLSDWISLSKFGYLAHEQDAITKNAQILILLYASSEDWDKIQALTSDDFFATCHDRYFSKTNEYLGPFYRRFISLLFLNSSVFIIDSINSSNAGYF